MRRPCLADQREIIGVIQRLDRQIDVEIRPVQVTRADESHVGQLRDRRITKPWELLKRQKAFLASNTHPEAARRYVRHFGGQISGPVAVRMKRRPTLALMTRRSTDSAARDRLSRLRDNRKSDTKGAENPYHRFVPNL